MTARALPLLLCLWLPPGVTGCGGGGSMSTVARTLAPAADTFINSQDPDNNDGGSASIFTGHNGQGGVMRGLVRFDLPADLEGRATVTSVRLTLTSRGLGATGMIAATAATESLQAVAEAWTAGDGVGDAATTFVVGQPCGGTITGATWNQPSCGTSDATWGAAGGTVAAAISGQAPVPATAADTAVTWDAASAGNAGMIAEVQGWTDDPATNFGWRVDSSTGDAPGAQAQRFYATEAGAHAPSLSLVYACKAGYAVATGSDGNKTCLASTAAGAAP